MSVFKSISLFLFSLTSTFCSVAITAELNNDPGEFFRNERLKDRELLNRSRESRQGASERQRSYVDDWRARQEEDRTRRDEEEEEKAYLRRQSSNVSDNINLLDKQMGREKSALEKRISKYNNTTWYSSTEQNEEYEKIQQLKSDYQQKLKDYEWQRIQLIHEKQDYEDQLQR